MQNNEYGRSVKKMRSAHTFNSLLIVWLAKEGVKELEAFVVCTQWLLWCDVMWCAAAVLHLKRTLNRKYEPSHTHSKTFPVQLDTRIQVEWKIRLGPAISSRTKINTKKTFTVLLDAYTNDFFSSFYVVSFRCYCWCSFLRCSLLSNVLFCTLFQRMIARCCAATFFYSFLIYNIFLVCLLLCVFLFHPILESLNAHK